MEEGAHRRQDYFVRRIVHLVLETQLSKLFLEGNSTRFECNTKRFHERAMMCLFCFFKKVSCFAALNARLSLSPGPSLSTPRAMEGIPRMYSKVVDYQLETYVADNLIHKAKASLARYNRSFTM